VANFPSAGSIIPDKIHTDDIPKVLRNIYTQIARNVASQDRVIANMFPGIQKDNDISHMRIAHSLKGMLHNVELIDWGKGITGDVLYLINNRQAMFGSAANPGSGGTAPSVGSNALLDGLYHTDTLAGVVVLGDLIAGNGTPKWARVPGQITAVRKFLRQTGTGAVSAVPVWDTLLAADIPALAAAAGWTDDGTIVRLTTSTDQVGIGTASPGGTLGIVNVNNVGDIIVKINAKAGQTGDVLASYNSNGRTNMVVNKQGNILLGQTNGLDAGILSALFIGGAGLASTTSSGNTHSIISWGDNGNALGPPTTTADMIGCAGARVYLYKDTTGRYDAALGQDTGSSWFMVGDENTPYYLATSIAFPGATFSRAVWYGNGDYTNYGVVESRKNLGAAGPGTPGITLETTGGGTNAILVQAPATITNLNTIQTLLNAVGSIPVVGNDDPAVASKALGKVDKTAIAAAIASTNLTNGGLAGMYLLDWTLLVTTADATAGTFQLSVAYTDTLGATTQTSGVATVLTATSRARGEMVIQLASGEIAYTGVLTGAFNNARAALYIRLMYLG